MSRVYLTGTRSQPSAVFEETDRGRAERVCAEEKSGPPTTERGEQDPALDQEGLGEEDPYRDILGASEEEGTADTDDAIATDLDIGMLLEDAPDAAHEQDADELVLDIGELLGAVDERDSHDTGEEEGPAVPDASYGIAELPSDRDSGAAEDLPEPATDLLEQQLPELDGSAEDEGVGLVDIASVGDPACDETLPDWTTQRWDARAVKPALPPSATLVLAGD